MYAKFAAGLVVGTGAAINIPLGFRPEYVRIVNAEDGDRIDEYFGSTENDADRMAAGTSITTSNTATTEVALRATNGITIAYGNESTPAGFTIGSGISENGKDLRFVAFGH